MPIPKYAVFKPQKVAETEKNEGSSEHKEGALDSITIFPTPSLPKAKEPNERNTLSFRDDSIPW